MALNTHALRFVANRKMRVSLGTLAREKCSIRGIDQFTFDAHVKVGAGATNLTQKAYVETHASRGNIRFACTPTRENGRSVLVFEFSRTSTSSPTSYRYELPNGWDDRWHHVAFSVSTGDGKYAIFFDDLKVKEGRITGGGFDQYNRALLIDKDIPKEIIIGAAPKGSSDYVYWDGKIDNVRLFRTFTNSNNYGSDDRPLDDHTNKVGSLAVDINLIEEWRFNEGPFGAFKGKTFGVVDHQYDPKLKADEYAEADNPNQNQNQGNDDFDPGPPVIVDASLLEDGKSSDYLWIGVDVSEDQKNSSGVVLLPKDSDRPFIGEGVIDTQPPGIPTDLKTSAVTEDSFEASWTGTSDDVFVQDYQIEVATQDSFASVVYTRRVSRRTTESIVGLVPAQRYYWRVRAIDSTGNESAWASSTAYVPFKLKSTSRVNYSPNPSFEGLQRHLHAWEPHAVSGSSPNLSVPSYATGEAKPDSNNLVYGTRYLKAQSNAGVSGLFRGAAHTFDWVKGREMKVAFWARGIAEFGVYLYAMQDTRVLETTSLLSVKNNTSNQNATTHILNSTWTKYSFSITPTTDKMNKVSLLFVNTTSAEFNFDLDGILVETGSNTGTYFDGSNKGTLTGDAYWAVFEKAPTTTRDGYLVGPQVDSTIYISNESPSVYDVEEYPVATVQTLDFADRTAPNPPSTDNVSHSAAADIGSSSFLAKWTAPTTNFEDIVAYELQVGLKSNLSLRDAFFVPGYSQLRIYDAVLVNGVYTRAVTGLAPETTYYYRVRAMDSNGNLSEWSSAGKPITTEAFIDTLPPSEVILEEPTDVAFDGFVANWREAIDDVAVAGYRLTIAKDANFEQIVSGYNNLDVGNVLSYEIFGLQDQTQYYYRVRAYDTSNNQSALPAQGQLVETLDRPPELGGFISQRLALESFLPIDSAQATTALNEATTVRLDKTKQALLQFTTNRTIARGDVKSAFLNLTRLAARGTDLVYKIYTLSPGSDVLLPYYPPTTTTFTNKPNDVAGDPLSIELDQQQVEQVTVTSLDITPLVQRGALYYGFRILAEPRLAISAQAAGFGSGVHAVAQLSSEGQGPRAVFLAQSSLRTLDTAGNLPQYTSDQYFTDFAGTQNSTDSYRPAISFTIDTASEKLLSVAQARLTSEAYVSRNLYKNPSFDTTATEFPIPNATFDLNDTRYWNAVLTDSTATLNKSNLSYDSTGGSGVLAVTQNNASEGGTIAEIVNEYQIPAIKGVTYTARAFAVTSNVNLKPRVAIYRYNEFGGLISKEVDTAAWSPTAGIWYLRQFQYKVDSNDNTTKFLRVVVTVQSNGTSQTGSVNIDTVSVTSDALDTPLFVETIGSSTTAVRSFSKSFDAGLTNSGASLLVTTAATSGTGVRLTADVPSGEAWIEDGLTTATINLVENPSFESSSVSHVSTVGGSTTVSSVFVSGARASRALKISSADQTHGVTIKSVRIPPYIVKSPKDQKFFVGSCWVLGGYTYAATLAIVYDDNTEEAAGSTVSFTVPAGEWQRLTVSSGSSITATGFTTNSNNSPINRIELRLTVTLGSTPTSAVTWYVDGAQIEECQNLSSVPTAYCDGDQLDCHWYGLAHSSISFRNAFVGSFKLQTDTSQTDLVSRLVVKSKSEATFESPQTAIGNLPDTTSTGWVSIKTWPVVALGTTSSVPPVSASIEVYTNAASARTFTVDAVSITCNDALRSYFNGATLKGIWRELPFSSISENSGVQFESRVHTRGNLYESGSVVSWFRSEDLVDMPYQTDDSFTSLYERDGRYVDVRIPDRIRWNEIHNPSFELNNSSWRSVNSNITTKLSDTADSGGSVGVWTVGSSPGSATLVNDDLVPAQAGQLWSARMRVRAPLIVRASVPSVQLGFVFYCKNSPTSETLTATTVVSQYFFVDRNNWATIENSSIAPANTKWVRLIVSNPSVSGGTFGMLATEQMELDSVMLYQGPAGRYYIDGDDNQSVMWEGRRHLSPSIFAFNGGSNYSFRFMAIDKDGLLLGDPVERSITAASEQGDFVQFLFDKHERNVTSRSIELVIPYLGSNRGQVTLTGVYRRTDTYDRIPVSVEVDYYNNRVFVRADDLTQNREYVFELDVVAEDRSKVYGEFQFSTRVSSGVEASQNSSRNGDGLIQFDGFTLNGPGSTYYWVSEHDAFSLPDRRTQIETIPRRDGGIELKAHWGTKKISMSGGVWGHSRSELYDNINSLRSALVKQKGKLLIDTLASNEDYYIATCTDFSTKEVAGESLYSMTWDASFECADPFFYRGSPKVSNFEIRSSKSPNALETFYTEDQRLTVYNAGTINALPKLSFDVVSGSGDYSVSFINETTGQRIMPKAVLSRNDSILVDTETQVIKKNQAINLDYVGSFIELQPGANVLRASIKDLKTSRHNLLLNPGVERGPLTFGATDSDGVRASYNLNLVSGQWQKVAVTGNTVSRTRFQTATNSEHAALVECDGLQTNQGVVFSTATQLAQSRFKTSPNQRRTFSASAYVRSDITARDVVLTRCFIRIWYTDGTVEDLSAQATATYRLNTQWKLIQLPTITSSEKSINYVEVLFLFKDQVLAPVNFLIDNVLLTQDDLAVDQVEASFRLSVQYKERFI